MVSENTQFTHEEHDRELKKQHYNAASNLSATSIHCPNFFFFGISNDNRLYLSQLL